MSPDKAGVYSVNVSGLTGQFTVKTPEGGIADVEPAEPEPSPVPLPQLPEEPETPSQPEPTGSPEEPAVTAQTAEETIPPPEPMARGLIVIYVACAVIVVGLAVFLFMRRRNAAGYRFD